MAKIKYSALVTGMSGKLNGSVMARNRAGSYVRNKTTPVNPQTDYQVAVRNRLAGQSAQWRGLTEFQRQSWIEAVDDWSNTNIWGDLVKPTGQNLFIKVNTSILNAGGSVLSLPPNKVGAEPVTEFSATNDISDSELILTFATAPVPANHALVVEATAGVSAGISYMKNRYRQISVLPATTATGENVFSDYVAKFGTPEAGKKVGLRVRMVNILTGETSLPLSTTIIWTA